MNDWEYPTTPGPWYRDDATGKLTHARDMPGAIPPAAPEVEVQGLTAFPLENVTLDDAAGDAAAPAQSTRKPKGTV